MGKRAIKILTKISKKVSADIPSLIAHRQFHIFNKTKTEVSTSKKLSRALSNDTVSSESSLSTYDRYFIMSILHAQEKYVFYVNYYKDSIPFPILNIKEFLSNERKKTVVEYLNKTNIVNNIVCGFTQKKIITSTGNMFNFITMFKMDAKIAVLTNAIFEDETLLLCEPRKGVGLDIDSEFVIVKVKSEILPKIEIEHKVNNLFYPGNKSKNELSTSMSSSLCYFAEENDNYSNMQNVYID